MASFKEVRNNMSEGLRFYMSLQEAIAVLAQQAGDYILTRRLQRWGGHADLSTPQPTREERCSQRCGMQCMLTHTPLVVAGYWRCGTNKILHNKAALL